MTEPHIVLFVAPTGVGKTQLALELLEREYLNHFDVVIILCPTLRHNEMHHQWKWFWTHPFIILVELGDSPGSHLCDWIETLDNLLAEHKTLFLIDGSIADETLNKQRQHLLGLAISKGIKVICYGCLRNPMLPFL